MLSFVILASFSSSISVSLNWTETLPRSPSWIHTGHPTGKPSKRQHAFIADPVIYFKQGLSHCVFLPISV